MRRFVRMDAIEKVLKALKKTAVAETQCSKTGQNNIIRTVEGVAQLINFITNDKMNQSVYF